MRINRSRKRAFWAHLLLTLVAFRGHSAAADLTYWARAKSANFLEGGQDYFLDRFVWFGPLRGLRVTRPALGHTSPYPLCRL
jgi:hypothetical protein